MGYDNNNPDPISMVGMDSSLFPPTPNISGLAAGNDAETSGAIPPLEPKVPDDLNSIDATLMENMGYDGPQDPHQLQNIHATLNADALEPTVPALGSVLPHTPWGGQDDYDFPASVGPPEEQATDETYEQFEARVLNKRAAQMYHIIKSKLEVEPSIPFSSMCTSRNTRKQVAQKFYTLLVLKKYQAVEMVQTGSYEDIGVMKGPKFDCASL
jgi:cohesin complex subunit SCC1